jgi:Protein of unknown function (DUF3168)
LAFEDSLFLSLSPLVDGRVYPLQMPENPTFPVILWSIVGGPRAAQSQDGGGVDNPRLRLDIWGQLYDDVVGVAVQVRSLLESRSQIDLGFSTVYEGEQDLLDPDTGNPRRILEFRVWMTQR